LKSFPHFSTKKEKLIHIPVDNTGENRFQNRRKTVKAVGLRFPGGRLKRDKIPKVEN
jgi:hypothetical protein